jgi:DnaJ like chaperone protein
MGLLGKIIGGGIGLVLGGPLGALIGVGVGHVYDKGKQSLENFDFTHQQKSQAAFYACFFGCLAKMMKADGVVTKDEVTCLKEIISKAFKLDTADRKAVLEIVHRAKDDNVSAQEYLKQLAQMVNYNRELGIALISALYSLALADNVLDHAEKNILYYAEDAFRLGSGTVDNMMGKIKKSSGISLKESYEILDCNSDMSDSEIKKVYRKKCLEFHPDILASKGLPEEFMKFSNEQMIKIHDAYKNIMNSKK